MKKIWFTLCLALALLTGCTGRQETTGTEMADTTAAEESEVALEQTAFEDWKQSYWWPFIETPDGYYTQGLVDVYNQEYGFKDAVCLFYFCPRGGDCFVPLCGKPNCMHNDENCNAYKGTVPLEFGYYDGALYYYVIASNYDFEHAAVFKMNLDGSNHQMVWELENYTGRTVRQKFHRGKMFIWLSAPDDRPKEKERLIVVDLKDGTQTEPAEEYLRQVSMPSLKSAYKDKVYGMVYGAGDTTDAHTLIEIDTVAKQTQTPLPGPITGVYSTDSTLYFYVPPEFKSETWSAGFHAYDRQSGEIQDYGQPTEDIYTALWDEDYIYAFSPYRDENWTERTIYLLSRDYELLGQIDEKEGLRYIGAASDRIFFGDYLATQYYYIDKSEIGSGTLNLKPMETVFPPVKSE